MSTTYGDGSDGALNVLTGTYNLNLNQKYQFSSIYVAPGATLSTTNTTGSVLYLLCSGTADIQGTIDVSNVVIPGNNTWSTTIDATSYSSPGVANGQTGGSSGSATGGSQSNGFGGGGAGGPVSDTYSSTVYSQSGGNGGAGSSIFGSPGTSVNATQTGSASITQTPGSSGSGSAGGSGAASAFWTLVSGSRVISVTSNSGRGGLSYGDNGLDGSGFWNDVSGFGTISYNWDSGGGGGGGGIAGKAGVHVVLRAPTLSITGTIITKGTNGGNGGNGGKRNLSSGNFSNGGGGGGGGGGGNAGTLYLTYDSITDTKTLINTGGVGGSRGGTYNADTFTGGTTGSTASAGTTVIRRASILTTAGTPVSIATTTYEMEHYDILTFGVPQSRAVSKTVFQSLPQKDYEYRVFNKAGAFIGVWRNPAGEPSWSQSINQNASELTVFLARSPDNRVTIQSILQDSSGGNITDSNGDNIYVTSEVANAVGDGTDVDMNLFVDLYVFYGGYESLLDTNGDPILDTSGDIITVQFGSPNGKRVYSGYIADYELAYGDHQGVTVTIAPHATEQSHIVFKDISGNTTISYLSQDPVKMARDAMDRSIADGSVITWDSSSMPLSGEVASYDFNLQTTKESVDKSVDLLPSGYYSFVDVGERKQYLLNKSATANHTFYYEKHITELNLKRSITQLINEVYFVGGEYDPVGHPGVDLYKYYNDTSSISTYRRGLLRLSDSRVTLSGSAAALSQSRINDFKDPGYTTTLTITDAVYDIETIKLGQMVAFKNFGSFVDNLLLQIVTLNRKKHSVTIDVGILIPSDGKRLEEIKRRLNTEDVSDIANIPS